MFLILYPVIWFISLIIFLLSESSLRKGRFRKALAISSPVHLLEMISVVFALSGDEYGDFHLFLLAPLHLFEIIFVFEFVWELIEVRRKGRFSGVGETFL